MTSSIHHRIPIHEDIREKLHSFYNSNRIPHIIFYGSSGSGKQTIVNDFLKEIYHGDEQKLKLNVMFVNCAHGKGIKFIREELKFFAKTNVQFNSGIWFKTIVLLNADHLTMDAQSALRRCIELFSHNTRFFIIVENKHKLLNPILSRFCEIYVPEYIHPTSGQRINLHQWQIQHTYPFHHIEKQRAFSCLDELLLLGEKNKKREMNHATMSNVVSDMYENGLSSYDFIAWVKASSLWTDYQKSNLCMCFSKIKPEFRCEKLLMMYLVDFLWNRPEADLRTVSFM
jgi:Cdc6-like AAA superfamily ATPase